MTHQVYIQTAADAVRELGGRQVVAEHLPCSPNAVSNAVKRGRLPSDWWFALKPLEDVKNIKLPASVFTFVRLPFAEQTSEEAARQECGLLASGEQGVCAG